MFSLFALAIVFGCANSQGIVDPNRCTERTGWWGETVQCPEGSVAAGLCTSGRNPDCNRAYSILKCCEVMNAKNVDACEQQDGSYGIHLRCTGEKAVTSVCTSGRDPDCGAKTYTRIQCCDGLGISVSNQCNWLYAGYGHLLSCGTNQVIAGVCSSGRDSDCNNHYTGIHCCYLN